MLNLLVAFFFKYFFYISAACYWTLTLDGRLLGLTFFFFLSLIWTKVVAIRYFNTMYPLILIDRQLLDIKYLKRFSYQLFVATNQISKKKLHTMVLWRFLCLLLGRFYTFISLFFEYGNNSLWELSVANNIWWWFKNRGQLNFIIHQYWKNFVLI